MALLPAVPRVRRGDVLFFESLEPTSLHESPEVYWLAVGTSRRASFARHNAKRLHPTPITRRGPRENKTRWRFDFTGVRERAATRREQSQQLRRILTGRPRCGVSGCKRDRKDLSA